MILLSFSIYLLLIVIIGLSSVIKKKNNSEDYLLAGRDIKPWMAGLSAVATNSSGYMFVGLVGYTYSTGLSSIWIAIGWVLGDFVSSFIVHKKLRIVSEEANILSFSSALSSWHGTNYKLVRVLCAIITIVFLVTYAAAQLNSSSKALNTLLGWEYNTSAIIGAAIIMIYCVSGGIRASIWTDSLQACVMLCAMLILVGFSIVKIGGFSSFVHQMNNISPTYSNLFPTDEFFGPFLGGALFILGWFISGFGVIGQPHIMIRFMSMDNASGITKARIYYYIGFSSIFILSICSGLMARIILNDSGSFDYELGLLVVAQQLLPDILIGVFLAGLFASSMSTADSQILSCSAAIAHDLCLPIKNRYLVTKISTVIITIIALLIAIYGAKSVFFLVILSWSVLASSFAPLITIYAFGHKVSQKIAFLTIISGFTGVIMSSIFQNKIHDIIIGCLFGYIPFLISYTKSNFSNKRN